MFDGSQSIYEDGTISAYAWDFGDGGRAAEPLAKHAYARNGEYPVKLTVTDNEGQRTTAEEAIAVGVPPLPVIEASTLEGMPPLNVELSAEKSSDGDGTIAAYRWEFDDGETAEGARVSRLFSKIGEYDVKLVIEDNDGIHAEAEQAIVAGQKPKAVITGAEKTYVGLRAVFDGGGSMDDGSITAYEWDFGDGTTEKGARVSHSFREPGAKKVVLTVLDNTGLKGAATSEVRVYGSDLADLRARLLEPISPVIVQNQDIQLKFEVLNAGERPTQAFKAELFDGSLSNKPLAGMQVEGLRPLEVREIAFKVNAGEKLQERKFYLSLDPDHKNRESNQVNNVLEAVKTVMLLEACGNDFDDDVDGYVDEGCIDGPVEGCGNRLDDDKDGKVDEGCGATDAAISGVPLVVSFGKTDPVVGEEQEVTVSHPRMGKLKEATVTLISPRGNRISLETDASGVARYRVEEAGRYKVEAFKYTLSTQAEFKSISEFTATQRQAALLPLALFGKQVFEMPLLVMVLSLLCVIATILAYDRSATLFKEELEIVKSRAELTRERGTRLGIGLLFLFVPLIFNKALGFEAGIVAAIAEIVVLYLTMHFERERF